MAEAYLPTKWHLDPSSRLATTEVGRKLGVCPLGEGVMGAHLTRCRLGRGLPLYQVEASTLHPHVMNVPSTRPTYIPNCILIGSAVFAQLMAESPYALQCVLKTRLTRD